MTAKHYRKGGIKMFARLTITQMKADKIQQGINLYKESVVPGVKSQKGFRGGYLLTDVKTCKAISISLWDSEDDAVATETSGFYQEQLGKFKDIFAAPPTKEGYEVTVQA
jgi:heme-degrading monooxygenase HmoA